MIELLPLKRLIAEQLYLVVNAERREALRALLVEPRVAEREWDYGALGERYPFWVVAEAPQRGTILVYCEQGFGPEMPWGFLWTDVPTATTLGMDAQWAWYLEEAFVRSGLWQGEIGPSEAFHLAPEERFAADHRPEA